MTPAHSNLNPRVQEALDRTPIMALSKNLKADPCVSVAIYSFPGPPGGNLGLQIAGHAAELPDQPTEGWQRFEITPQEAWIFDSRVYGKERRRIQLEDRHLEKGANQ